MPTTETPKRTKPKTIIVLEALHVGLPIQLDGYELVTSDTGEVCIEATRARYENGQPVDAGTQLLPFEVSLNGFIRACEDLPDDEITRIAASTALTKHKRQEARRR